jgi:hypothetical protein
MNPAPPRKGFVPKAKALNCPNCGSQIELRALGAAAGVICSYCSSTIDASHPQLKIIGQWQAAMTVEPAIPLGSRGKLKGVLWEAIGFQQRGINVEGTNYFWREYVLWNPYQGFRYLSEYNNHWNFVTPLQTLPAGTSMMGTPGMILGPDKYRHFQTAVAVTWFVIGEFPWMVQVGETVQTADYVAPPKLLSSEMTENEVTWSQGEYMKGADIWQAFQLKTQCPPPMGVFANQPSPYAGRVKSAWKFYGLMCLVLFGMMLFFAITSRGEKVFEKSFTINAARTGEKSFVTDTFTLAGNNDNVEVNVDADVFNRWFYLSMALINDDTGEAFDFGTEVSYYTGTDSDGSWTEGSRSNDVLLPNVPGGRYYLRIEPETDPVTASMPIPMRINVIRGVPYYFRYFFGMFLLLIPPIWTSIRSAAFESKRWSESDYAGGGE